MGQGSSSHHLRTHPSVLEWKTYVKAEWRSPRARELDELGGLARPTIARGNSFQSRLDFLGVQVLGQADEITELFEKYKQGKFHELNQKGGNEVVAQWRIKVHAARRRVILVVWGMIRFRSTIKHRSRLRRVDTFGYMIPLIFGPDTNKFIAEQLKCISARAEVAAEAAAAAVAAAAAAATALEGVAENDQDELGAPVICASPRLNPSSPAIGTSIWLDPPGPLLERSNSPPDRRPLTPTPPGAMPLPTPPSRGALVGMPNGTLRRSRASQNGDPGSCLLGGPSSRTSSGALVAESDAALFDVAGGGLKLPKASGAPGAGALQSASAPSSGSEVPAMPKIPFSRSTMRRAAARSSQAGNEPSPAAALGRTSRWSVSGATESHASSNGRTYGPSEYPPASDGILSRTMRMGRTSRWSTAGGTTAAASDSEQMGPGSKSRFNQPGRLVIGSYPDHDIPSPKMVLRDAPLTDRPQWNGLHHTAKVWSGPKLSTISAEIFQPSAKGGVTPTGGLKQTGRLKLPLLGPAAISDPSPDLGRHGKAERSRRSSVVSNPEVPPSPLAANAGAGGGGQAAAGGESWPSNLLTDGPPSSTPAGANPSRMHATVPGGSKGASPAHAGDPLAASFDEGQRSSMAAAAACNGGGPTSNKLLDGLEAMDQAARARRELLSGSGPPARQATLTRSESRRGDQSAADMMLAMYLNRCNTTWTSQQEWRVPSVVTTAQQADWDMNSSSKDHYGSVLKLVKKGKVAFWFLVGEDSLPTARGVESASPSHDIWTADPYDFIANCRPGLLHDQEDKIIKGYTYQSRALGRLATAVWDAGGKEALSNTHIVLSINDEQQEEVTQSLWDHRFYGFDRSNVIIIAQNKRPGYRYEPSSQRFVVASELSTPWESNGSGIAAMQLNWCPDAFTLNADGLVEPILGTTTELLNQREIEWMMCYRARDLITMEGCLDYKVLALAHWLHYTQQATMITQVLLSDKMSTARALDSLVLNRIKEGNTEIRMAELSSHALDQAVEKAKAQNGNKVAVGIQRYLFHVPSLKNHLVDNKDFRPKLKLRDGLLFVKYDIADMSCTPGASLAALQLAEQPTLLMSDQDLDMLLASTQRQDRKQTLLNHLDALRPKATLSPVMFSTPKAPSSSGNTTVVFVERGMTSLPAVRMAVTLSRPGKDVVNLCTFVSEAGHVEHGRIALQQILERLGKAPVNINIDVLVRGGRSLLEAMAAYVTSWKADLVVVPSSCLSRTEPQALLGSVALAILKRIEVPVLMITSKATTAANAMYDRNMMRLMLVVEGWTMPLVEYSCQRLLQPRKGDKLVLGQVHSSRVATHQQLNNMRHYMAQARGHTETKNIELSTPPLLLDGLYATEIDRAVRENRVNILAVQLPPGTKAVPKHLLTVLCNSTSAMLIMKASR